MADEREQRMVYQKVDLVEYQKDHWDVYLKVPRPARMMEQMMERMTEPQMVHQMAEEREQRMADRKVHMMAYQKDCWVVSVKVPRPARMMVQKMEQMMKHQMVY